MNLPKRLAAIRFSSACKTWPAAASQSIQLRARSMPMSRATSAKPLRGRAVLEACREAIAQCKQMAAELLGVSNRELIEERGGIRCGKEHLTWAEVLEKYFEMQGASIVGRAYLRRAADLKDVPVF